MHPTEGPRDTFISCSRDFALLRTHPIFSIRHSSAIFATLYERSFPTIPKSSLIRENPPDRYRLMEL